MPTIIRRNERSWAISMISDINIKLQSLNLRIIRAGGETTISTGHQKSMTKIWKRQRKFLILLNKKKWRKKYDR